LIEPRHETSTNAMNEMKDDADDFPCRPDFMMPIYLETAVAEILCDGQTRSDFIV
jgi:hypothetical protein